MFFVTLKQNNNRGGYNIGDRSFQPFDPTAPFLTPEVTFDRANVQKGQYQLMYFEGSTVPIEWTNQHACGGSEDTDPQKMNCHIVIQYTCDTDNSVVTDKTLQVSMRDGGVTTTSNEPTSEADADTQKTQNAANQFGVFESEHWYWNCKARERNKGLFLADQIPKGLGAKFTRQNPGGTRRGLECPEERDYYPYWTPSPWIDVAYLTNEFLNLNVNPCALVKAGSMNNNKIYKCTPPFTTTPPNNLIPIYGTICTKYGGTWEGFTHDQPAPACLPAGWSRDNHLGNGAYDALPLNYTWTVPAFDTMKKNKLTYSSPFETNDLLKCQLRLRYNITTDDYDPWNTDASVNQNKAQKIVSPVTQNPTVDIEADLQGLKLAINTAQFGRTFQDRSHVFYVRKRPTGKDLTQSSTIHNLNVRGKRGNIVQVYPAVEYDFVPSRLLAKVGDFVHIQWTGSNTHINGPNGGDGQTGNDGQGTAGTDRSNFVLTTEEGMNFPMPLDKYPDNMFSAVTCYDTEQYAQIDSTSCAVILATSGHFTSKAAAEASATAFDPLLNTSPASLIGGILLKFNKKGTYYYISTRNNNFSNRSQKGVITVV